MTSSAVLELLALLSRAGIETWLDGGWGVDALLGRPTRAHHDLDLLVRVADIPKLLEVCSAKGLSIHSGSPPHSFVLANADLEIDIHAVTFDVSGDAIHRMDNGEEWRFTADSFSGVGTIDGEPVSCLSAEAQVRCHAQGYTLAEKDLRDMELLHEELGIELPRSLQRRSGTSG
jgi:lincosamide nucleotidyltransferase A/C/D/E